MAIFKWINGEVPKNILITQVYGIVFSNDKRILLKVDKGHYSLAGGKPERYDNGLKDTLKRELLEEVNIEIDEPHIVGYQLVIDDNGKDPCAQVRMAATINRIGNIKPDLDSGRTYKRMLVPPQRAIELLDWGDVGRKQINEAIRIVEKYTYFNFIENKTLEI